MDIDSRWGLRLASVMFLTSTLVHCHNQTSTNASSSTLEEIVPGSLKIGTGNVFAAPDLFGGEPFSLRTNPVTGEVDFQTRTVDVQTVNEARDREEAKKVAELREDLQSRVPSSAHLPLEARDEEYVDAWGEPIKRGDVEYYDEEPEAREPIMVPQKGYSPQPMTTPKEEESFMSIFESLFGGGGEEEKTSNEVKPTSKPYNPPYRQPYPTTPLFTTENIRPTTRQPATTTERRPLPTTTTERHVYQQYPERYSNYHQPPERPLTPSKAPERYNPYQQANRPPHQPQRVPEPTSSRPHIPERQNPYQKEPDRQAPEKPPYHVMPERQNVYQPKPVTENTNEQGSYQSSPQRQPALFQREPEKESPKYPEKQNTYHTTLAPVKEVHHVTPEKPNYPPNYTERPTSQQTETEAPKEKPTTEPIVSSPKPPQNEWQTVEKNTLENNKENINRQDVFQNEIKPTNHHNAPDYFNFINLPVHYSNKDTAIPLISTSYANTKVQGMGASKYEKNNGKYSNHKYDPSTTTTRRPSYWSTKRPTSRPSTTRTPPSFSHPVDFTSLEYDEAAIGSSADFGGYGHKAGVKVESTPTPTRPAPTRTTFSSTTLSATSAVTSTSTASSTTSTTSPRLPLPTRPPPPVREPQTRPPPVRESQTRPPLVREPQTRPPLVREPQTRPPPLREYSPTRPPFREPSPSPAPVREYEEYDYESYPAQVKPVSNPTLTTTRKPVDSIPDETRTTITTPKPKEPEYEYYDYDTEAPIAPPPTTTTTTGAPTTTTQKFKLRYPSLSKDKIRRPDEKVEVVVPSRIETTSQTTTSAQPSTTTIHYFQRPTSPKEPAPVFEEHEEESPPPRTTPKEEVKPIIVTAGKHENENVNIVLVPAKSTTTERVAVSTATTRRPDPPVPSRHPSLDYTTEFTVGVVHGQGPPGGHHPGQHQPPHQGHYIASSIAASPFEGPDEPFRPIARPAGMSASFQVVGEDVDLTKDPEQGESFRPPPAEPDVHEPHEFIPSPQFHRPESNHFVIGTSFNTKPQTKPGSPYKNTDYYQPPPPPAANNEVISIKPKPQRPIYTPPASGAPDYFNFNPGPERPNFVDSNRPYFPQKPVPEETYYKPTSKPPVYHSSKPAPSDDEDYGFFDVKPGSLSSKPQTNVELSVDYDFDGIQTEPKPGQYVIFPKPQLNSEINDQVKKSPNTPIPHYHEKPSTEPPRTTVAPSTTVHLPLKQPQDEEKQQANAPNYPRPHWEKNGKPSFLVNSQGVRSPLLPPQMSPNLIPPGNIPPRFRKPVSPSSLPPVRKTYNEGNFQTKPKPNLPNILPQFRPNAKIGGPQRPYRPMPPNRRHETFPYRIQNEPDALMHRDFEIEEEIIPKFITNRVRVPEYDEMMIQKRLGLAAPPPAPRRVQRTPVTTLQMLQQNHGMKKHQVPSTREDQADPSAPLVPPVYKPYKEVKKDVYVVYPVKTPFNSNIKIEDPDKIDYSFNQTSDQVPLLKPSKKKEKPKPDFPYGFETPEDKLKGQEKEVKEPQKEGRPSQEHQQIPGRSPQSEVRPNLQDYQPNGARAPTSDVRPNIQDYMPSGVKMPNEKQERIDMNLHMQSNNQWNQVSTQEVITRKEDAPAKVNPPTQYHTLMKNTNASEFTLGAVMHTLPEQNRKGQVTSVTLNEESLVRPGLNVNERIANGKIVTVSMPLDVKEEKQEPTRFQAPFQASSTAHGSQGWNILEHPEGVDSHPENVTENANGTFNIENFTPELIGGFKPIYTTVEPDEEMPQETPKK